MDDDDYYYPTRVRHAVSTLETTGLQIAGSTTLPIYFEHDNELWVSGPFDKNHATANTFAMTKDFASKNQYNSKSICNEEKEFLKNYTVPLAQLDPWKTIICISHESNTFDKKKMRKHGESQRMKHANTEITNQAISALKVYGYAKTAEKKPNSVHINLLSKRRQIQEAGKLAKTDKTIHHRYDRFYARSLAFTPQDASILEIGYGKGESTVFWKKLYPKSTLIIFDKDHAEKAEDFTCIKCDQSNEIALKNALESAGQKTFDLIIDDGSHYPKHQIRTFIYLFQYLAEGGTYIIEDIETSYWKSGNLYGYQYGKEECHGGQISDESCVEFFKEYIQVINREFVDKGSIESQARNLNSSLPIPDPMIESVLFGHNCIIVSKAFANDIPISERPYRFAKNLRP